MVTWFAGLFYLPRLFVYHAQTEDEISLERFKIMERKLYFGIMTPGGLLTILFGAWLAMVNGWSSYLAMGWFNLKMLLVIGLIGYHIYCGKLLLDFKQDRNIHSHVFYRWLNEVPTVVLISIVLLAVIKPSL